MSSRSYNRREIVINDVKSGKIDACGCLGRFRDTELIGRILRDRAGPLHVEDGFTSLAVTTPGSGPFRMICGSLAGKPNTLRKSRTSWILMFV